MKDRTDGQCLCGAIGFEVSGPASWVSHCHCLSCRRNTGCAVVTFVGYPVENVKFVRGERAFYVSSAGVRRGFCKDCGTPMSYEADRFAGEIHLYVSTLENPDDFVPQNHVHYDEKISWFDTDDNLPRNQSGG